MGSTLKSDPNLDCLLPNTNLITGPQSVLYCPLCCPLTSWYSFHLMFLHLEWFFISSSYWTSTHTSQPSLSAPSSWILCSISSQLSWLLVFYNSHVASLSLSTLNYNNFWYAVNGKLFENLGGEIFTFTFLKSLTK